MIVASILFVDDEPNLLEGLKRMLRPLRREWRATFVTSGAAALNLLEREHFDVVVTDVRMPEMDGAVLLEQLVLRYPAVTRIVLSGYADQPVLQRATALAHHYLSKPCDPETLRAQVFQALAQRAQVSEALADERVSEAKAPAGLETVVEAAVAASPSPSVCAPAVSPNLPGAAGPEKVLFVDDEPAVLETFRRMLTSARTAELCDATPFVVHTASGGDDACAMLASDGPFAVIVSDLRMPRMDGIQFLERAREMAPETVRILLTGDADGEVALDAFDQGTIFWFLTKPCKWERLADTIAGAIRHHHVLLAERAL